MNRDHKIRDALPREAEILSEIAFRSKAYWGYSEEFMRQCQDELTVLPGDIETGAFVYSLLERDQVIAGFYALEQLPHNEFSLEALYVDPDHIGSGVGRALITHCKARAFQLGGRKLIVQSDPNAEGFYCAAGGVIVGTMESASIKGRFLPLLEIALADHGAAK